MAHKQPCAKYEYVVTSSGPKIVPVTEAYSKDEESPADYNSGGYLQVKLKDTFKNGRYTVLRKLGYVLIISRGYGNRATFSCALSKPPVFYLLLTSITRLAGATSPPSGSSKTISECSLSYLSSSSSSPPSSSRNPWSAEKIRFFGIKTFDRFVPSPNLTRPVSSSSVAMETSGSALVTMTHDARRHGHRGCAAYHPMAAFRRPSSTVTP